MYHLSVSLTTAVVFLSGCTNIAPIGEYSSAAAKLIPEGKAISTRWEKSDETLKSNTSLVEKFLSKEDYIGCRNPRTEEEQKTVESQSAIYQNLLTILSEYFVAISRLSGKDLPNIDTQVEALITAINPENEETKKSYTAIGKFLSEPLNAYRNVNIKKIIEKYDPDVENLLEDAGRISKQIRKSLETEKKNMNKCYIYLASDASDKGIKFLILNAGKVEEKEKYGELEIMLVQYEKGLEDIYEQHKKIKLGQEPTLESIANILKIRDNFLDVKK